MAKSSNIPSAGVQNDLVRRPLSGFVLWWLPIGIGAASAFSQWRPSVVAVTWAGAFAWMSTACFINAYRCHRLHCYIAGPVLLLGAIAAAALAFSARSFGPHALDYVVSATFAAVLVSFVPEFVWRKYV